MSENDTARLYGELKAVNSKIDNLTELFNRAAYGEGFNRCARHSARLKQMEGNLELAHGRISGVKKWLIAGLVSLVSLLANFTWNMLQSSIKQ